MWRRSWCLFDLEADPSERSDLAALPAHAERLQAMVARAEQLGASAFHSRLPQEQPGEQCLTDEEQKARGEGYVLPRCAPLVFWRRMHAEREQRAAAAAAALQRHADVPPTQPQKNAKPPSARQRSGWRRTMNARKTAMIASKPQPVALQPAGTGCWFFQCLSGRHAG